MKQATCHPERPHETKGLCKACSNRAWRAVNKERKAGIDRVWRTAHPGYFHAWYVANTEGVAIRQQAYRLANRERRAETVRAWRAANPEKRQAWDGQRRARKLGAIGTITSDQWASIKAAYAWRCAYCGKKPATLTQDHVIPLSLGGSHIPANIVPACRSCNSSKGDRPPTRLPALRLLI